MRARRPSNLPHSIHARLLNLAKERKRPFNELLQHYAMERFLYRLGRSRHREAFLLKGALMLRVWSASPARPTLDIDLAGTRPASRERLEAVIRDCLAISVPDDGLQFDPETIRAEPIRKEAEYEGWRFRFHGRLGNARLFWQVDFGFGDAVVPGPDPVEYPALLDGPPPTILAYPIESAVAEKVQAMVALDMANSRLRDFYDLWFLSRTVAFDGTRLVEALRATFERRGTPVPGGPPTALTPTFSEDREKRRQWSAFLRKGSLDADGKELPEVVEDLRRFLLPPCLSLSSSQPFEASWPPRGPWRPGRRQPQT